MECYAFTLCSTDKNRNVCINIKLRCICVTIVALEKQEVSYSGCVCVALVIQHAKYMLHFTLSSVACLAVPYLSMLSHELHDFLKKIYYKMCILVLYKIFACNTFHSKKNSVRYCDKCRYVKCPLFLLDFNQTQIFLIDFSKYTEVSYFMKMHSVVAELFQWVDGWTDTMT